METHQLYTILGSNIAIFLSIFAGNIGLFLWAIRQSRSDFLRLDKKIDDNRRETQSLCREIHNTVIEIKDEIKDFHNRLCAIEKERKIK